MQSAPLVSVIIVVWNSKAYLHTCLRKLATQSFQDFEIILVDNGSSDGALDDLEGRYPSLSLKVERLDTNHGFAVANNIGARLAQGQWLALLNADAFPEPDWLEHLLEAAEEHQKYSFFSSRQIQANSPELLDGAGDAYHISGLAWRQHYNQPIHHFGSDSYEVFGACATAALYSRNIFLKIGGFDEDYFSYFEDVDLSFRLRLAGEQCLYVPQAVVQHIGSASKGRVSDFVIYHGHRNLVWTYFKNMPGKLFWIYLPLHIIMNLYFMISFFLKGRGDAILKAKVDAVRNLPKVLRKRKTVQQNSKATISEIYRVMERGLFTPVRVSIERRCFGNKLK